jgi:3-hydroxyacyl-CoA dehydrogenase/enoyl-CoA hydratase/3-hydroxybutyryl-CoA epimerase
MLGGGLMGGGIAYVTMQAGVHVRLKDRDDASVGRGMKYVRGILEERAKKKQITREELEQRFALLTGTTDYSGLKHADLVIEAVYEDLALKRQILRDVEAATSPECVFASNTSSIPITEIAEASKHPETVIGMHYFSPVHKMPLLEVIETNRSAPWAIATAVALGKKQGKSVIVVKDGVGFYTSRILAPYMNEAARLLAEGVPVEAIDRAMVDWGYPVGPIQLLDEVGIDVAAHVGEIVHAAFGDRMLPAPGMRKLLGDERKGRKNARGFYVYEDTKAGGAKRAKGSAGAAKTVDASVYDVLGVTPKGKLPAEEIQMRCALQMVNEALLSFGEAIVRSPRDGDIGAIFGLGFPPFRGGPFRYVDTIGAAEVLRRLRSYEMRFGRRFTPAPILVEMARRGERFYS